MDCNVCFRGDPHSNISCSFKTKPNVLKRISHNDTALNINRCLIHCDNTWTLISRCDTRNTWNGDWGMASNDNADGRGVLPLSLSARTTLRPLGNVDPRTRDETTTERECKLKDKNGNAEKTTQMNEYSVVNNKAVPFVRKFIPSIVAPSLCGLGKRGVVSLKVIDLSADVVLIEHPATGKGNVAPATFEPTGRYRSMR
ncbi:hypothetical protein BC827DRAFT_1157174 [Russula dissimulans]|nr:hypothetical protein BC827DRAFT_1157174 [Russula dissimulans]